MPGGRPPKPLELKVLHGTDRADRRPANPVKVAPKKVSCPKWLDKIASKEWRRIVKLLYSLKLVTELDVAALASYCNSYSLLQKAQEEIDARGLIITTTEGNLIQNPAVGIVNTQKKMINTFCSKFGLSPSDRSRLEIPQDNDKPADPMQELIGNG